MYVTINGARLFFDSVGAHLSASEDGPAAKPALLVLHGGPGFDHWGMRDYFDRFADIAQVIYIDHRGNGRSRGGAGSDTTTWTLEQWGDDIAAFCDALGIEKPIVYGQSFGGMVAQSYGRRHPAHAGALVFSSTAACMTLKDVLDGFEALGGAAVRPVAERFWTRGSDADIAEYLKVCTPLYNTTPRSPLAARGAVMQWDVYRHFSLPDGAIWSMDLRPGLDRIEAPVLVITGEHDPVTPPARSREIYAALNPARARYLEVPGTGHGAYRDKPDEIEAVLRDFIAGAITP